MKRGIGFVLVICLFFVMTGCGPDSQMVHLSDRTIVQGIAVDRAPGGFEVTIQAYKSSKEGEEPKYDLHTAQGKSVFEALRNLTLVTGKRPFYSDNQVIILGKEVVENGLSEVLDYFVRDNEIRTNASLLCTDTKAQELLNIDSEGSMMPAQRIARIIEAGQYNAKTAKGELMDVVGRMRLRGQDAYIPFATLVEQDDKTSIQMEGVAYFDDEKYVGVLDEERTRGLLILLNKAKRSPFVLENEIGRVSFGMIQSNSEVEASIQDGVPHFSISVKAKFLLESVDQKNYVKQGIDVIPELEKQLNDKICGEMEAAVEEAFRAGRSDIFLFGMHLRQQCPDYWKVNEENWRERMTDAVFEYKCESFVYRVGQEANPE